jgi:predicted nucleic acid-binding protein
VRSIAVDANVFVSFFVDRQRLQRDAAHTLLQKCEEGEIAALVPQFVIFEITYVLQSQYGVTGERLAAMIRDLITFPGVHVVNDCPWNRVLEFWPNPLRSLADAAIVALAATNRCDAVATFDQKLVRKLKDLGVASYW